jgi:hypothetical protein
MAGGLPYYQLMDKTDWTEKVWALAGLAAAVLMAMMAVDLLRGKKAMPEDDDDSGD